MREPFITLEGVSYRYPRSPAWALREVSLTVYRGEFLAVLGENGAGKSTLCCLCGGLIPRSLGGRLRGTVSPPGGLALGVGIVLEDPEAQIFTSSVRDEAAFGPENLLLPPEEIRERVRKALAITGLEAWGDCSPGVLSGGQKQRLAIAGALAMADQALILDEPTAHLDPRGAGEILRVIREIREQRHLTILMATHRIAEIAGLADRICLLREGAIQALGTPREILGQRDLLEANGIQAPELSELAWDLAARGDPLPSLPLTVAEAQAGVLGWYRGAP